MISPWVGIGVAVLSAMIGAFVRVFDFTPKQKKLASWGCIVGMVIGLAIIVYGLMSGAQEVKSSASITQDHPTNSPAIIGDGSQITINPDVNPNAPVVTYGFKGERFTANLPHVLGVMTETQTPQAEVFKAMVKLEQERNWPALKKVCEGETEKTPEWLTPPLLCAETYAQLGEIDKAIERAEYVQKRAGGRKDYAGADRLREDIRQKTGK